MPLGLRYTGINVPTWPVDTSPKTMDTGSEWVVRELYGLVISIALMCLLYAGLGVFVWLGPFLASPGGSVP